MTFFTSFVLAQTGGTAIQVVHVQPFEEEGHFRVGVYFNVVSSTERHPITDVNIEAATLTLDGQTYQDEDPIKPSTPLYVALLLDTSSMTSESLEVLRESANRAISRAPNAAFFAIAPFQNSSLVSFDFVPPVAAQDRIAQLTTNTLSSSLCLDAVLHQSLQQLSTIQQRRSLVIFTDGDEPNCTLQDINTAIQQAKDNLITVHIIALQEQLLNEPLLRQITSETGGLYLSGSSAVLEGLFEEVMMLFDSQWLALFEVYPTQGVHTGTLNITVSNGLPPTSSAVTFTAQQSYTPPVGVVDLAVTGVNLAPTTSGTQVTVLIELGNMAEVAQLELNILNEGNLVETFLATPQPTITFETPPLLADERYEVTITARDTNGAVLQRTEPFSFNYNAPTPELSFRSVDVQYDIDAIQVTLNALHPELIDAYEVSVLDENNVRIQVYPGIIPESGQPLPALVIDSGAFKKRQYTLVLQGTDIYGNLLPPADEWKLSYNQPGKPITAIIQDLLGDHVVTKIALGGLVLFMAGFIYRMAYLDRQITSRSRRKAKKQAHRREDSKKRFEQQIQQQKNRISKQMDSRITITNLPLDEYEQPLARLVVVSTPSKVIQPGRTYRLLTKEIKLGKRQCDIILDDTYISRFHASILYKAGRYYLVDRGSENGTILDGDELVPQKEYPLSDGQHITLGYETVLRFEKK